MGRARQAKGRDYYEGDVNLPAFLTAKNLKPYIDNDLYVTSSQITFRTMKGDRCVRRNGLRLGRCRSGWYMKVKISPNKISCINPEIAYKKSVTPLAWLKGLVAAVIGGTATALTSIGGATLVGSPLNYSQISAVGISAAFFSACTFLAKSPIPDQGPTVVNVIDARNLPPATESLIDKIAK